jgi:hypothetical protein
LRQLGRAACNLWCSKEVATMASRAHVIHDYAFGNGHARPRRQLQYRNDTDPVVVPRTNILQAGGGALATAFAMGALLLGSAYAAYHQPAPQLQDTPALPVADTWQPDTLFAAAQLTNVLQGPLSAAPDKPGPFIAETSLEEDVQSSSSLAESRSSESREVIIDDSKMYPPTQSVPYPNPTTTPPDAVAPPATTPQTPTPALDPENPYRDSEQL